jgi:hypothetical protein
VFSQLIYLTKSYFECRAGWWESLRVAREILFESTQSTFLFFIIWVHSVRILLCCYPLGTNAGERLHDADWPRTHFLIFYIVYFINLNISIEKENFYMLGVIRMAVAVAFGTSRRSLPPSLCMQATERTIVYILKFPRLGGGVGSPGSRRAVV